ncbi:MAG: choice-of-anchor J domain-containing protein [Bacteroidales bacterium]|jgi:hypothetical protein|nr:choice-of-anchor J domain-containing protein [Bacteroidales bacterium]
MKKLLLLIGWMAFSSMILAQSIDEDFNGDFPAGWITIDKGHNPGTWSIDSVAGRDESGALFLDCYAADSTDSGTPDDWVITNQVTVAQGDIISFWADGGYVTTGEYFPDSVTIYASKTGTAEGDFTIVVGGVLLEDNGFAKYSFSLDENPDIDVDDAIYLAFYCNSNGSQVIIDDLWVGPYLAPALQNAAAIDDHSLWAYYDQEVVQDSLDVSEYLLKTGTEITFTTAEVDAANNFRVKLTTSSTIGNDLTIDQLIYEANEDTLEFYAGLSPIAYLSVTNPDGILEDGYPATFKGIVSAVTEDRVWFQDGVGAYHGVNTYALTDADHVLAGDEILVVGELDIYDNQSEIYPSMLVDIISSGNDIYPAEIIPGADIASTIAVETNPAEKYEGSLVKINHAVAIDTVTVEGDIYWSFSDDDGTTQFYVGARMGLINIDENTFIEGEEYHISGIVSNRDGIYSLNPRAGDIEEVVGIGDTVLKDLMIYPNPVKTELTLENIKEVNQITIINMLGQTIKQINVYGKQKLKIDLSELNSGLYFISFYNDKGIVKSAKILKE